MKELFQLRDGRMIADESFSDKMFMIYERHPEQIPDSDTGYEWSEMGMAELFGVLYDHEARYCPEHRSWYTYVDGVWQHDEGAIYVSEKLKDFVRLMILYCAEIEDEDKRQEYLKFVNRMGDRRMRDRILKDATGVMPIAAAKLDANPYLINCQNGTYDLQTMSFRPHQWDDFLTMRTAFDYTISRDKRCERWERFIDEVTQGDKDKADFLQRALGYSLLGRSNEECIFILHGKTTRNGKSTLLNTIETTLGDYARVAPVGIICRGDFKKDAESASPILAGLKGKRFVTMAESNEYGKLDEERIKQYTGGEEISARALYQSAVTFLPQFTMWLSCNDLPMVSDQSLFASGRIKVIEFNRHFSADEQDKNLKDELCQKDAMVGIFAWMLRGYEKYKVKGLEMSKPLENVVDHYRANNDMVLMFLQYRCERANEKTWIRSRELYLAYKQWAKFEGLPVLSAQKFRAGMERNCDWYVKAGMTDGYPTYRGIKLKEVI